MLKVCATCLRTWSGGRDCPRCGEGHPLHDVAVAQSRAVFLRDRELAETIRGYYGARSGMLVAFWGVLLGLVLAIWLSRRAMLSSGGAALLWWGLTAFCAVVPFAVAVLAGDRVVRRFSRACLGRAPGPAEIRIAARETAPAGEAAPGAREVAPGAGEGRGAPAR
jgi:hypothetical protein